MTLLLIITLAVGTLQLPMAHNPHHKIPAAPLPASATLETNGPFILIFLDFRDFMCPSCLDSLLSVCRALPRHLLMTRVMGIIHCYDPDPLSPRQIKILRKKIKGFVRANRILFPVLLDKNPPRDPSGIVKTQLWVLSGASRELVRFDFPLSSADIDSLCRMIF